MMKNLEEIKRYLDECIMFWRTKRDNEHEWSQIAEYYIDAYQSVRVSIFDELLK